MMNQRKSPLPCGSGLKKLKRLNREFKSNKKGEADTPYSARLAQLLS